MRAAGVTTPGASRSRSRSTQTHAGDPYRLLVDIGLVQVAGASRRVERVELKDREAAFVFASDAEPASVVLDPETWLLMEMGPFIKKN